jgi:hypothetical protein
MLDSIALALQKCPKLSNIIIESCDAHGDVFKRHEKQDRLYHSLLRVADERFMWKYRQCLYSTEFDIWDILKPIHDADRALDSLVLLDRYLTCSELSNILTTGIFHSMKHLRHHGSSSKFLAYIVARAPKLESIGVVGTIGDWDKCSLQSLVGRAVLENLRACGMNLIGFEEDDLVQFLLRHSNTLQALRICKESYTSVVNWSSFIRRVGGRLPYLRRVEISELKRSLQYPLRISRNERTWSPIVTPMDLSWPREYDLETGPMGTENGLWEDYEELFFPGFFKS